MDLLGERPKLSVNDRSWRILSRNRALPPHFVGSNAVIQNSIVSEGCEIYGTVINSVLSPGVVVCADAVVRDSVIFDDVRVKAGATVDYSLLDSGTTVGTGAHIGKPISEAKGITLVGSGLDIPDGLEVADDLVFGDAELKQLTGGGTAK